MLFIWDVTVRWGQSFSFMRRKAFQGGRDGTWQCELKAAEPKNGKKAHFVLCAFDQNFDAPFILTTESFAASPSP